MLRALRWTVRQRRYRAMIAGAIVLAIGCIMAGTFEATRYLDKRHENRTLRAQARAAAVALTPSLVPRVEPGEQTRGSGTALLYRTITALGSFDTGGEQYLGSQSQGGRQGYLVLTPLRTATGTLLVARGFIAETATATRPSTIPRPPSGRVRVTGRLYPGETRSDDLGRLGRDEIRSVNPAQQAARSGAAVYSAYVRLGKGQPGTRGLHILPRPDLSNPSGGAGEAQLFSYIVQWYVFALLALAAPFAIARNEIRDAQRRYLGVDPDAGEFDAVPAAVGAPGSDGDGAHGELVVRRGGQLVRPGEASPRWREAERLADRYGRSLGPVPAVQRDSAVAGTGGRTSGEEPVRSSAKVPHRATDDYHGAYNDYLWELALADGGLTTGPRETAAQPEPDPSTPIAQVPRVIDAIEPCAELSSGDGPHGDDPHGSDPHGSDPHDSDPHGSDPHGDGPAPTNGPRHQ